MGEKLIRFCLAGLLGSLVLPALGVSARWELMPESSAVYPPTTLGGFTSASGLASAPFALTSVHFRGRLKGGSQEVLNGSRLVYRYKVKFEKPVLLEHLIIRGAAFNGGTSVMRLLDSSKNVLKSARTTQGNNYAAQILDCRGVTGTEFYIDEFDDSWDWRFRDAICLSYRGIGSSVSVSASASGSAPYSPGTTFGGYTSQGWLREHPADLLSVHYRGTGAGGNGLVYRILFTYSQPTVFRYAFTRGIAFLNGTFVATAPPQVGIGQMSTAGAPFNGYYAFLMDTQRFTGTSVQLEEMENSSTFRYRDAIALVSEPKEGVPVTGKIVLNQLEGGTAGEPVDVEIRKDGQVIGNRQVFLNSTGDYWLQVEASGPVSFLFKGRHWLSKRVDANLGPNGATGVSAILTNGDVDGDNAVTVFDYAVLSDFFDRTGADADWNKFGSNGYRPSDADLDGDHAVTVFDYAVLSENFDLVGDN